MGQYVGIDLHRRRSVIVRHDERGEVLDKARIDNDPVAFATEIAKAGEHPEVVLEATYGWYWAADVLAECGATVHLAHPPGVKMFAYRRVKNDERDAADLADLLRMGRLPEAWIASPDVRELREVVRYRAKLVTIRTGLKAQVHAVLAKEGVAVPMSDLFGRAGLELIEQVQLGRAYRQRVGSLLGLIDAFDHEIALLSVDLTDRLRRDRGYLALQTIPGIGPTLAAIFVAEIGDISRFAGPRQLACWAGLTPRHYESDTTVKRGSISKQGSRLVRWAAVEAVQRQPFGSKLRADYDRIALRRGKPIAKIACARKMIHKVFYALRDGHVRSLPAVAAA